MNFDITGLSLDDLILDLVAEKYKSDASELPKFVVNSDKLISSESYSEVTKRIDRALPQEIEIYSFKYFRWVPLSVLLSLLLLLYWCQMLCSPHFFVLLTFQN